MSVHVVLDLHRLPTQHAEKPLGLGHLVCHLVKTRCIRISATFLPRGELLGGLVAHGVLPLLVGGHQHGSVEAMSVHIGSGEVHGVTRRLERLLLFEIPFEGFPMAEESRNLRLHSFAGAF